MTCQLNPTLLDHSTDPSTLVQVRTAVADMMRGAPVAVDAGLADEGVPLPQLMRELEELKSADVKPADGLTFAYVYTPFEKTVHDVAHKVCYDSLGEYAAL